jgi:hypothetical protein
MTCKTQLHPEWYRFHRLAALQVYRAQDLGAGRKLMKPCSELNRVAVMVFDQTSQR